MKHIHLPAVMFFPAIHIKKIGLSFLWKKAFTVITQMTSALIENKKEEKKGGGGHPDIFV